MLLLLLAALLALIVMLAFARFPTGILRGLSRKDAEAALKNGVADAHYIEGQHAETEGGRTFFRLFGRRDAPKKIVFIHGISTPSVGFVDLVDALLGGERGEFFEALIWDCFGRGFSDAPDTESTPELYMNQLESLLANEAVGWTRNQSFTLVGYSLGGSVASHFAAKRADLVERLLLIAPAGVYLPSPSIGVSIRNNLLNVPLIGEALGVAAIRPIMRSAFGKQIPPGGVQDVALAQIALSPAYARSLYRTVVNLNTEFTGAAVEARAIRVIGERADLPVMLVWGSEDKVVLPQTSRDWLRLVPHAELLILDGEDHVVVSKSPAKLAEAVRGFLMPMPMPAE